MPTKRLRLLSYMVGGFPLSLFEKIAETIDADLDYDETRSGPAPGTDPFRDGTADLGWICSTSFVDMAARAPEPSVEIAGVAWVPEDLECAGRPVYFGDLVVAADSDIASLADLSGRSVGCNDEVSLSGFFALHIALRELGHDLSSFLRLHFTGGHRYSLQALVDGEVDASVIDSVVLADAARTDPRVADLRRIARLGPWPTQPLVASTRLPREQIAEIRNALLASNDDPEMQAELSGACLARFTEVDAAHYAPVRAALERL